MKRHKTLIWITLGIAALLVIIYLIPGSLDLLALMKEKVLTGEYWRILTYAWAHTDGRHLIENTLGLLIVSLIAYEVRARTSSYFFTYALAAIAAILPLWLFVPFVAAGASAAMYAVLAFVILSSGTFEKRSVYALPVLLLLIFLGTLSSLFAGDGAAKGAIIQDFAHASGLVLGIACFFGIQAIEHYSARKKRNILRKISGEH